MKPVETFKALADQTRVRIVRMLMDAGEPLCVCELVDVLQKPQYAVSRALAVLRNAHLVEEHRRGKLMFYSLTSSPAVDGLGLMLRVPPHDPGELEALATDRDRLRWRLDLRQNGECLITYTHGYNPDDYSTVPSATAGKSRRVLFICVHNSARSQMAEEYLRKVAGDLAIVESAGLEPGELNPFVVDVLADDGIDIRGKKTRSVFEVYKAGKTYDYVITVCSREAEENCPVFPGPVRRLNWPFEDPGQFTGDRRTVRRETERVYRLIQEQINQFVTELRKNAATSEKRGAVRV